MVNSRSVCSAIINDMSARVPAAISRHRVQAAGAGGQIGGHKVHLQNVGQGKGHQGAHQDQSDDGGDNLRQRLEGQQKNGFIKLEPTVQPSTA